MNSKSIYRNAFWTFFILCNTIVTNLFISYDYKDWEFSALYLWGVLIYWLLISSGISIIVILINIFSFFIKKRTLFPSSFLNVFSIFTAFYGCIIWVITRIINLPLTDINWHLAAICGGAGLFLTILLLMLNRKTNNLNLNKK